MSVTPERIKYRLKNYLIASLCNNRPNQSDIVEAILFLFLKANGTERFGVLANKFPRIRLHKAFFMALVDKVQHKQIMYVEEDTIPVKLSDRTLTVINEYLVLASPTRYLIHYPKDFYNNYACKSRLF